MLFDRPPTLSGSHRDEGTGDERKNEFCDERHCFVARPPAQGSNPNQPKRMMRAEKDEERKRIKRTSQNGPRRERERGTVAVVFGDRKGERGDRPMEHFPSLHCRCPRRMEVSTSFINCFCLFAWLLNSGVILHRFSVPKLIKNRSQIDDKSYP